MSKEPKFEHVLRICVLDFLTKYFSYGDIVATLYALIKCNKNIHHSVIEKLIKIFRFPLSVISKCSDRYLKKYAKNISNVLFDSSQIQDFDRLSVIPNITS